MQKNKLIPVLFIAFLAALLIYSCKGCGKNNTSTTDNGNTTNASFGENPPVAEEVSLEKIEGNSNEVLLHVRFAGGLIKEPVITIDNDGEKVVLRDDGKSGDAKNADGIYTAKIKTTEEEIKSVLADQRNFFKQNNGSLPVFEGRSLVVKKLPAETGDMELFMRNKRVDFRFPVPCVTAPFDTIKVQNNCVMVTDLKVVQDTTRTFNKTAPPGLQGNKYGVWTFWQLMRQLASKDPAHIATDNETSNFIVEWLSAWNTTQIVNGDTVPQRSAQMKSQIVNQWISPVTGQLLPEKTPFRLMAIANRVDLRGNMGYSNINGAGEGRFVFCATNGGALQFTVIFEYGVNKTTCATAKSYAKQWWALKDSVLGSKNYNKALEAITLQFTQSGTNTTRVNQSSLNQLRTNEIALGAPWELREFNLKNTAPVASLKMVTVKRNPAPKYNAQVANPNVKRMAKWVNSNAAVYLVEKDAGISLPDSLPLTSAAPLPLTPFLGGHSIVPSPSTFWDADPFPNPDSINNPFVRHYFSLNTCAGCHAGETQTFFTHINPSNFGITATMSRFLTGAGMPIEDPAHRIPLSPATFTFADLKRRAIDLNNLANCPCGGLKGLMQLLFFKPLGNVH